jgi:hypothetical protein
MIRFEGGPTTTVATRVSVELVVRVTAVKLAAIATAAAATERKVVMGIAWAVFGTHARCVCVCVNE